MNSLVNFLLTVCRIEVVKVMTL